jgi:hypothetical protein
MNQQWVKCDRCLRYKVLFQYTKIEVPKIIITKEYTIENGIKIVTTDLAKSRGLCEECAVSINKKQYDKRLS